LDEPPLDATGRDCDYLRRHDIVEGCGYQVGEHRNQAVRSFRSVEVQHVLESTTFGHV